jgi:hypothetical protein
VSFDGVDPLSLKNGVLIGTWKILVTQPFEVKYLQLNLSEVFEMKTLLLALLLSSQLVAAAPSRFNGTWIIDWASTQLQQPQVPTEFLLAEGMFGTKGQRIKADGTDQKVPKTADWDTRIDTVSVRIVDDHKVELVSKKETKTMFTEVDTVSGDGKTLTRVLKDTTGDGAFTTETVSERIEEGPKGAHLLSGSWQAYEVIESKDGATITYRATASGFAAETPLGKKFDARFDGLFYRVEDDPGQAMVRVRVLDPNSVEQTVTRAGKIVGVMRLTLASDGKTIDATYENKLSNTTTRYKMRKLVN